MQLNSCHTNKQFDDQVILGKICFDILSQDLDLSKKKNSDLFCICVVDGRDRPINSYEDWAMFKSSKISSIANYPIFAFVANTCSFLNNDYTTITNWRINIIKIPQLNNLIEYSKFCINELFFRIPEKFKNIIMLQSDGFFSGKSGWEDYVLDNKFDYIGSHWQHNAGIIYKEDDKWHKFSNDLVKIGNGAFSYRNASKMRVLSEKFNNLELAELGCQNFNYPKEDLFFSYFSYLMRYNLPTLEQACKFCKDPINLRQYLDKVSYGFHYPAIDNKYCCLIH